MGVDLELSNQNPIVIIQKHNVLTKMKLAYILYMIYSYIFYGYT